LLSYVRSSALKSENGKSQRLHIWRA
jgi:hypothetical protein